MKVIIQLVRSLELIKVPAARALIVWMVGEYNSIGEIIPKMLPTVLKYLSWCFTTESLEAKLQILNTAVKVGRMGELFLFPLFLSICICIRLGKNWFMSNFLGFDRPMTIKSFGPT